MEGENSPASGAEASAPVTGDASAREPAAPRPAPTGVERLGDAARAGGAWLREPGNGALVLALAAGAALRLSVVPLARWNDDENGLYATALGIARGVEHPSFGPPITDTAAQLPGPALHYVHAAALVLGRGHPYAIGVLITALHLMGIVVFARAVRATVSDAAGTLTGVLLALAPWDVMFSDRPYNPNLCVAAFTLMVGAFALGHRRRSGALQGLGVFLALVCPQMHMSSVVAFPVLAAMALAGRWAHRDSGAVPGLRWRWLLAGLLLGVATYAPAIASELGTGWANLRLMRAVGLGGRRDAYEWLRSLLGVLYFASAEIGWHVLKGYWNPGVDPVLYPRDAAQWAEVGRFYGAWRPVVVASFLTAAGAHALLLLRAVAGRGRMLWRDLWCPAYVVVLAGCAGLLAYGKKIYFPHYNVIALPLAVLVVARALAPLVERGRGAAWLVAAWVALSGTAGAVAVRRYYGTIDGLTGIGRQREIVALICARQQGRRFGVEFVWFNEIGLYRTLAARIGCAWEEEPPWRASIRYVVEPADRPRRRPEDAQGMRVWELPPLRVTLLAPAGDPVLEP